MKDKPRISALLPFWDRSLRMLLKRPRHLAAVVRLTKPELADRLDFERLLVVNPSFISEEFRQREGDLVFRLPYRDAATMREVIVNLLMEHQSTIDRLTTFRVLTYMQRTWEDQLRQARRRPDKFAPIIPFVLFTGAGRWRAPRDFPSLVDSPEMLARYVPSFVIMFLELPEVPPSALEASGPIGWVFRAIQELDADHPEFVRVLNQAAAALRPLFGDEWRELIRFFVELVHRTRRPEEREELDAVLISAAHDPAGVSEVHSMTMTIADELEQKGRVKAARDHILQLGAQRFGAPSDQHRRRIENIDDGETLDAILLRVLVARDWDDLLNG